MQPSALDNMSFVKDKKKKIVKLYFRLGFCNKEKKLTSVQTKKETDWRSLHHNKDTWVSLVMPSEQGSIPFCCLIK